MFENPTELDPTLADLVGTVLAKRYRVDAVLGVGAMGAVFEGFHLGLKQKIALKVLHPHLAGEEQISKRFDREAMSASRLDHPNCVRIMDYGTSKSGIKYLVMQFLEGEELGARLDEEGPMAPERAVDLIGQVLDGLEHAHERGVAHRDLKPANIFVTHDVKDREVLKLVDFGMSKLMDGAPADGLSRAGLVFGTPHYMSPEQALGQPSDHRADIYAAGILLFVMLAGKRPYPDEEDPVAIIRHHVATPLPPLPSTVPAGLGPVVTKMTAKKAEDRFATAAEAREALQIGLHGAPAAPAAPAPAVAAAAVRTGGTMIAEPASTDTRRQAYAIVAAIVAIIGLAVLYQLAWG